MTRQAIVSFFLAGAAVLLGANGASADPKQSYDPRAAFAETNANSDGAIDLGEFHARLVEVFYNADKDKDGFLVIDEYEQTVFPNDFEKADTNGDGKLSLHEFVAIRYQEFVASDKNQDGELSVDEVVDAFEVEDQ